MKKLSLLLLMSIIFFSCNSEKSNDRELQQVSKATRDSFDLARVERYKKDSLILAEQDKAIANINFGISEKQFEKEKNIFLKNTEFLNDYDLTSNGIGGYVFSNIDGSFYQDKLYSVYISGDLIKYDRYDALFEQQKGIIDRIFVSKFGNPEYNYPLKAWHTFESNAQYSSAQWKIGRKIISTLLSNSGNYYTYDLSIFQPEINGLVQEEKRLKEEKELNKGIDKI